MSSDSKLSNRLEDVIKYLDFISKLPYIEKIFIVGSRSPKSKKSSTERSDWDFKIFSSNNKVKLPHPRRDLGLLHADILMVYNLEFLKTDKKAVEVYPTDELKVLVLDTEGI